MKRCSVTDCSFKRCSPQSFTTLVTKDETRQFCLSNNAFSRLDLKPMSSRALDSVPTVLEAKIESFQGPKLFSYNHPDQWHLFVQIILLLKSAREGMKIFWSLLITLPTMHRQSPLGIRLHRLLLVLYDHFICHYSFPARLHSDKGTHFESHIMKELCSIAGVKKSCTTPYHPSGNGMTERFNQTPLSMLSTLDEDKKSDWKSYVVPMYHAYNATRHDTTGFSPHPII